MKLLKLKNLGWLLFLGIMLGIAIFMLIAIRA